MLDFWSKLGISGQILAKQGEGLMVIGLLYIRVLFLKDIQLLDSTQK